MFALLLIATSIDLSAFDAECSPVTAVALDLSAFTPAVDLTAFEPEPVTTIRLDLSAFDDKPAVKPSPAALDYPKRSSNWTHPGNTKDALIDHMMKHPNHGGKFDASMLNALDYRELESLHSDDHEHRVKAIEVAALKPAANPAGVSCPNGVCPVVTPHATQASGSKTLTGTTSQPVYYYQPACPNGRCPTTQRVGLFGWIKSR